MPQTSSPSPSHSPALVDPAATYDVRNGGWSGRLTGADVLAAYCSNGRLPLSLRLTLTDRAVTTTVAAETDRDRQAWSRGEL